MIQPFRRKRQYLLSGRHSWFTSRLVLLVVSLAVAGIAFAGVLLFSRRGNALPSAESVYREWNDGNYAAAREKAMQVLARRPLDGEMLSLRGFSAYYLSVSQVDSSESQAFLAESIIALRNAWYRVSQADRVPLAYILGKAYYQRGFYYADLAMKYLDYANAAGASYSDLSEFRGLAASLLGNHEVAIAAYSEALSGDPSDLLLYTLATSYLKNGDTAKAKQYFTETIRTTEDELLILKCKGEIARMLLAEGALDEAEREFAAILEKDANSADAHYGLGVVYENRGDLVKARASWRKAVRISPVHAGARQKLGI